VNDAIRSRRFALESILRGLCGTIALLVILMLSGCVGVTGKGTTQTATGVSIEISPSTVSFGNLAVGQSATKTVTVTNSGTEMLAVSGISVAGTGFTASGPKLPISLSAGQSASISAVFKPTAGVADTGTITIASNADGAPSLIALSGTGTTAAALSATPNSIAFGSVAVGSTATETVHLENTGSEAATISKMAFSGTGVSVSGVTVPMTVASGQTVNLTVTYKPVSPGTLTGTVSITSNATDASMVIGINATATSSTLAATPSSVSFGNVVVGSDTTQTIRLENIGTSQVTISSITPSVAGVGISGVTLPVSLAPGTSATVTAAYKPTGAGSVSGKITVTSSAVGSPTIIDLSATAAAASIQLTPSATSLSFGNVGVGSTGTSQLTVKSTGNTNASISKVTVSGTGFVLGSSAAGLTLDPTQSESYTVNFDPKATGSVAGTLTITSNAANSPMNIALSGSGVTAAAKHTVALAWDRSSSTVTGYFVYRSSKPSGPYTQLNSTPEANPTYSDGTVSSGQVYYYYVTAVDSSNIQSADSNQVSVTIPSN
jgi:Abnormal spindle-like microcephaly-assoc'd, ASPM-SPD-2-Hydin/HYDIN/CFA65/VesB-like, Ig-like domain